MKLGNMITTLAAGALLSFNAHAAVGSGVRGGGHVVDIDSTPYLMDLVTKTTCDWKRGSELISELPELRNTLNKLAKIDWYFAADLKDEISYLNFCMTGPLYKVPAHDWNSVTVPVKNERTRQAAYRLYENAYVDSDIFNAMNDVNKAMLIVHETMHSYLSMNEAERALKLKSIVKVLDKVRNNEIITREKLHYAMEMNSLTFPTTVAKLDKSKESILFLKGSLESKKNKIITNSDLDKLIEVYGSVAASLASWDDGSFGREYQRVNILSEAVLHAMRELSGEELRSFLAEKKSEKINIIQVALNNFYSFSEEQRDVVFNSDKFLTMIQSGFDQILDEKLEVSNTLISASAKFQELVTTERCVETSPLVNLSSANKLPVKLRWLVETIVNLHENGHLNIITSNESFYRAIGLKNQIDQVKTMNLKIERERKVSLVRLELLSQALVKGLLNEIEARVSTKEYAEIVKQINVSNF